jgi:hypothetical protein
VIDEELRAIAKAPSGDFVIRRAAPIDVRFSTDSDGDVTALTMSVGYDQVARSTPALYRDALRLEAVRPLDIELRPEKPADWQAKSSGLSVEWQSGDSEFDAAIYVQTPTTNPHILAAVLGPEVRSAVLALRELHFVVIIDRDGSVSAVIARAHFDASKGAGQRALAAFEQVIGHLPAILASSTKRPPLPLSGWTNALGFLGAAGWLLNVGYATIVAMLVQTCAPSTRKANVSGSTIVLLILFAIVAGIFGARWYGRAVERRVRGSSDAHVRGAGARISAFGGFSVLAFTIAWIAVLLSAKPGD